jgi:uncharacterized HAD superfamily protein
MAGESQRVDIAFESVPLPRAFEWNILHHYVVSRACVDIGALCAEPATDGDDYGRSIAEAKPLIIPTSRVHTLFTRRPERFRPETELWLERHGVTYDTLIMAGPPDGNRKPDMDADVKRVADYYADPETNLMLCIVARPGQARQIVRLTGKPVYCVGDNLMRNPSIVESLGAQMAWGEKVVAIARVLPRPVQDWMKPLYRKVRKGPGSTDAVSSP